MPRASCYRLVGMIVLAIVATICGCASPDYEPGIAGVRDVPSVYHSRSGTINDWSPCTER